MRSHTRTPASFVHASARALILLPALPWLYFIFLQLSRSIQLSSVFNYYTLILMIVSFFSYKALSRPRDKYALFFKVLGLSWVGSLLFFPALVFGASVVSFLIQVIYQIAGGWVFIALAVSTSLVLTYVFFFHRTVLGSNARTVLEKVLSFWMLWLFTLDAIVTHIRAATSIDAWVDDASRAAFFLVALIFCVRLRLDRYITTRKLRTFAYHFFLAFSFFTIVMFADLISEVQYNLSIEYKLRESNLSINHLVTEEHFEQHLRERKLNTVEEYYHIIGKPDAVVQSYEFLKGGQIEKQYYCRRFYPGSSCRGYQLTVKDGLVTSAGPYWAPHTFEYMIPHLFDNWMWNRFFGVLPFKDFS